MKVSVIIPIYNVERFLVRCLDSVVAAARQFVETDDSNSVEVICVDDGSTDNSPALLADYVARQLPSESLTFTILTKPNGGLASARNFGMDRMTGDYLMFVDSDDYIPSDAISTFASVAVDSNLPLIVSDTFLKDRGHGVIFQPPTQRCIWRQRPSTWIAGRKVQYSAWNKFYRADLMKTRRFSEKVRAFEDYPFTTQCFCDVERIAVVERPLYVYCVNPMATSIIHSPYSLRKLIDAILGVRTILAHATGKKSWAFALRQAGDGLSSAIGKTFRARSEDLRRDLIVRIDALMSDYPQLLFHLSTKAKIRLWLMRRKDLKARGTD